MNQIRRILVLIDPWVVGRQASVDKAAHLARCVDASVELLICITASKLNDMRTTLYRHSAPLPHTELLDLLETLAVPLRKQGTNVALRIIHGKSLADSLLNYQQDSGVDLIVKDSHHHPLGTRIIFGSPDWHLTRYCQIALLLTKTKPWGLLPVIMAAVDPIHANPRIAALDCEILSSAAALAAWLPGDLHIVHTYVPTAFAAVMAAGGRSTTTEYSEALQAENSFRRSQMEDFVRAYGVAQEHLHVEMGTPEDCLPESVAKCRADVVVIGASSHGEWHRMIAGSTVGTIVESLASDILIVRASADK